MKLSLLQHACESLAAYKMVIGHGLMATLRTPPPKLEVHVPLLVLTMWLMPTRNWNLPEWDEEICEFWLLSRQTHVKTNCNRLLFGSGVVFIPQCACVLKACWKTTLPRPKHVLNPPPPLPSPLLAYNVQAAKVLRHSLISVLYNLRFHRPTKALGLFLAPCFSVSQCLHCTNFFRFELHKAHNR